MTKESAGWLILRSVGLLFLGCAAFTLYEIAVHSLTASILSGIEGNLAETAEQKLVRTWALIGVAIVKALVLAALAYYFLIKGKRFHVLLMREENS